MALKPALALYDFDVAQRRECGAEIVGQLQAITPVWQHNLPPLAREGKRPSQRKHAPACEARRLL